MRDDGEKAAITWRRVSPHTLRHTLINLHLPHPLRQPPLPAPEFQPSPAKRVALVLAGHFFLTMFSLVVQKQIRLLGSS